MKKLPAVIGLAGTGALILRWFCEYITGVICPEILKLINPFDLKAAQPSIILLIILVTILAIEVVLVICKLLYPWGILKFSMSLILISVAISNFILHGEHILGEPTRDILHYLESTGQTLPYFTWLLMFVFGFLGPLLTVVSLALQVHHERRTFWKYRLR